MMKLSNIILSISAITVSACSDLSVTTDKRGQAFGTAVANNVAVQSGQLTGAMTANLTRKFASEAPATVNFAFNSAQLDSQARSALQQQANWIKAHPQIVFTVYGHADKVGSEYYNHSLGKLRARASVNYLVSLGVNRSKVRAVASFGETRPVVLTEAPNRQNRRAVTEVTGFGSHKKGGQLDGKYALEVYRRYITLETHSIIQDQGGLVENTAAEGSE